MSSLCVGGLGSNAAEASILLVNMLQIIFIIATILFFSSSYSSTSSHTSPYYLSKNTEYIKFVVYKFTISVCYYLIAKSIFAEVLGKFMTTRFTNAAYMLNFSVNCNAC